MIRLIKNLRKMKKVLFSIMSLVSALCLGQEGRVGVNTTDPKTTMDVRGKTNALGVSLATDITGLQAPRLTREELTNKGELLYGTDQSGALVYITDVTAGTASGQRINMTTSGYYYFNGSVWVKIGAGDTAPEINLYKDDGTLTNNRTVTQNGNSLAITGTNQRTVFSPNAGISQEALASSTTGLANIIITSPDRNSNGTVSRLSLQSFPESNAQVFAGLDASTLDVGSNATTNPVPLRFLTSSGSGALGTEKARIGADGRMGIGVTIPSELLDVNGNVRFRSVPTATALATGDEFLVLSSNGTAKKITNPAANSIVDAQNGLTKTPSNFVELGGDLTRATTVSNLSATNTMQFTGTGINAFSVDGTTFSVDADANRIGIGTAAPTQALDVRGNINVENANAGVVVNSTDSTPSRLVLTRSNGGVNLAANDEIGRINFNGRRNGAVATLSTILSTYEGNGTTNLTGYEFYNNGILATPSLVLRSTGNLGVGVVSPSEKLDVNGNIKFSGALMPNNDPGTNFQILKSTGSDSPPVWSPDVNTLGNEAGRVSSANGVSTTITPCNTSAANKNVTLIRVFSNLDGLNNGLYLELLVTTGANTGVQELHNLRFNGGTTTADTSTAGTWTYNLGNGIFRVILSGTNRPFTVRFEGASFAGNIVYECLR